MFENLTGRMSDVLRNLRGQGRLSEENIKETLREVRMTLLEADVALPVVKTLLANIKERAIGQEVLQSLTPGQAFVKVVSDELIQIMGEACSDLNLKTTPPAVILMAGLQGAGKTTSVAKLALRLREHEKKSVLVVSCDIYRPAAIQQLETLAKQVKVHFFPSSTKDNPIKIAKAAIKQAKKLAADVVLVDTAGRLHVDTEMMQEIKDLHKAINPIETLFVVDSMTGQDAANVAKSFNESLPLTGVILTKTDGDARGGAALSIRQITGKPIKFIGVGEKINALDPFYPERIASRILGMGDVLTLVEEVQKKTDLDKAAKLVKKIRKGKGFDLEDFREQMNQMLDMGGVSEILDKLPGVNEIPKSVKSQMNDKDIIHMVAIINSMTMKERRYPNIIKGARKRRIAGGSGTQVQEVNKLLKQFMQMQKMMKKKGGMAKMMDAASGMMPKGMPFKL